MIEYGMVRALFYCPSNPEQAVDGLWNFNSNFRVTGYWYMYKRINGPMSGQTLTGSAYVGSLLIDDPVEQELVADASLETAGNFAYTQGGWPLPHKSNHIKGTDVVGTSIVFVDGHATWRGKSDMLLRRGGPNHWF